jgi:exosortase H (IPTLxxWG-CTERM-specific)
MAAPNVPAPMRRFLIRFPIFLGTGLGLLQIPTVTATVGALAVWQVAVCATLIRMLGGHAGVAGALLQSPSGFMVRVENGCDGVNVTILLWAAVLSYPAPWMLKAKGLAAGTGALHALNLARIISLFYLGQYSREWFEFAHLYLWEGLIVLDTLAIFWLWAAHARKSDRFLDAPA